MAQLSIREAILADADAIAAISRNDLGYDCTGEAVKERLFHLNHDRERVFVSECDGQVIGYIHAELYETLYYPTLVNILGLAVSSDYRRIGVGRLLLSEAEAWAKKVHAVGVRLNSGASRTDAHTFYRAMGLTDEKEQLRFIKWFV